MQALLESYRQFKLRNFPLRSLYEVNKVPDAPILETPDADAHVGFGFILCFSALIYSDIDF
jgi:hypothetical protein